jgi:hypothetical protein
MLLGFPLWDQYYFDKTLPMGLSFSCKLFEHFSTAVHWILDHKSRSRPKNVKVVVGKTVLSALIGKPICFDIVKNISNVCRQSGELADWIIDHKLGGSGCVHFLDDFLFVGPANSPLCLQTLEMFLTMSKQIGLPIKAIFELKMIELILQFA